MQPYFAELFCDTKVVAQLWHLSPRLCYSTLEVYSIFQWINCRPPFKVLNESPSLILQIRSQIRVANPTILPVDLRLLELLRQLVYHFR